jgi:hypothetical protein
MEIIKRIQLLTDAEISDLYDRPDFTLEERELFFTLSPIELRALNQYHNTRTRVYFILQLGYFRAKQQFYSFHFEDVADDTRFILKRHFGRIGIGWKGGLSRDSIRTQKKDIHGLFDYREFSTDLEPQISNKLCELILWRQTTVGFIATD